jgi:hypothetical protein
VSRLNERAGSDGLDGGRVQAAETAMGEAAGVRDLARGVRRAGVCSITAGVVRPTGLEVATRGVVVAAVAWTGVADTGVVIVAAGATWARSVFRAGAGGGAAFVRSVVSARAGGGATWVRSVVSARARGGATWVRCVFRVGAGGGATWVRSVVSARAGGGATWVRCVFRVGAGGGAAWVRCVFRVGAGGGAAWVRCVFRVGAGGGAAWVRSVFSAGAGESLPHCALVETLDASRGGRCPSAAAAPARVLQGDCAGVALGVVEDMAVEVESLEREVPTLRENGHTHCITRCVQSRDSDVDQQEVTSLCKGSVVCSW